MKKILFILFISFLSCNSNQSSYIQLDSSLVQQPSEPKKITTENIQFDNDLLVNRDSLSNYSYFLTLSSNGEKILGRGTGFIIKYNAKYYLVTAYHVLSGRNPLTDSLLYKAASDFKYVSIWFAPKNGKYFVNKSYQLFDRYGRKTYFTIPAQIGTTDLAVVRIAEKSFPKDAKVYTIDESMIDTTDKNVDNGKVVIVGFPSSQNMADYSKPTTFVGNTLSIGTSSELQRNADIYYDITTIEGMSGSPVYLYRNQHLLLAGVNSMDANDKTSNSELNKVKGTAADIFYAMRIIRIINKLFKEQ